MDSVQFHPVAGRRIAFRHLSGSGPTLVFLPGYMSDMAGSKATALFEWARETGRGCLLLDFSGCGQSEGSFAEGTLSRWADEVLALIEARVAGPVVLVGSSMGGWLMLLAGRRLADRGQADWLHGLVGVAAAPDFTAWGYDAAQRAALAAGQPVFEANPYGPEPTPTYPAFWEDAQAHLLLDGEIALDCPVRLLHGVADADVPWTVSQRLMAALRSPGVHLTLVKDGDHRLSRAQDIALLHAAVATI